MTPQVTLPFLKMTPQQNGCPPPPSQLVNDQLLKYLQGGKYFWIEFDWASLKLMNLTRNKIESYGT